MEQETFSDVGAFRSVIRKRPVIMETTVSYEARSNPVPTATADRCSES